VSEEVAALDRYRGPGYRRLLAAARRSLERTGGALSGRVSVPDPDDAERKAIIGITGIHQPAGTKRLTLSLAVLDAAVSRATGGGLAELLTVLGGPLRDRPAESASLAAARAELASLAGASQLCVSCEWYREWLAVLRSDGTLTKLASLGDAEVVDQAVRAMEFLAGRTAGTGAVSGVQPGGVPIALPALAAQITGDTKALNHGTALSTLVLRALALQAGAPRPGSAAERRELWDRAGVLVDDLASRVLVLNVPAEGRGLAEWLTGAARLGVPFYVTLHQLMTLPLTIRGALVHVCENPAVLRRAAAELGAGSAPLLCAEGQPSAAFHQLAAVVARGGGELRYHGDFDWPGLAIAGSVMRRHGARPWRMSAADYIAGIRADAEHVRLTGTPQPTPWDPELAEVMTATGRVLYEETVTDALVSDLSASGARPDL